jgi:ribosomal protein S18 acetylase RimI-like enzyme
MRRAAILPLMTVSVRPFGPDDLAACIRIFDRAWHHGHPWSPRTIDAGVFWHETEKEDILVAETPEGGLAGFAAVYRPARFIHHLYVDPQAHGRGIGQTLLEAGVALAGRPASLKCQTGNVAALGFYRRLGWIERDRGHSETGPWVRLEMP